jgi:hypothetical protein
MSTFRAAATMIAALAITLATTATTATADDTPWTGGGSGHIATTR